LGWYRFGGSLVKFKIMRFFKFTFLLLAGLLASVGCLSVNRNTPENAGLHRQWMLVEYKDFTKDHLTELNANMDLTKRPENKNQYGAKMGCNGMFFSAEFKNDGSAVFSKVGSTMMYCEGRMDVETAFGKDLPLMNHYKIEGHYLTLSNGNTKMKFVAADWD